MSMKNETNVVHMELEDGVNEKSRRKLNTYACACVMAVTIISAIFGYGE